MSDEDNLRLQVAGFHYSPLEEGDIRLLHILPARADNGGLIECTLSHHDLECVRYASYNALSYMWGEVSGGQDIYIDGKRLYARPNLHACLRSLRHHSLSHYVWIDAICMNQEDLAEKSVQVQRMGSIYSKAEKVAICLPANDDEIATFFEVVEHYSRHYDQNLAVTENQDPLKMHQAVQWLAYNPYFRRMWIVQENVLAIDRVLLCGKNRIPFFYIARVVCESEFTCPFDQAEHSALIVVSGLQHVCGGTPFNLQAKNEPPAPSLFNALVRYHGQQCFDRRDRVFALLGLPEMQKPKIQHVCYADYDKPVEDLLLEILDWWEKSPTLTARHQTQLQRYSLLQDTLGQLNLEAIMCTMIETQRDTSLARCAFEVKTTTTRKAVQLPLILTDAYYKGRVSAIAMLQDYAPALDVLGSTADEENACANRSFLDLIGSGLRHEGLMIGFTTEETAMRALREIEHHPQPLGESSVSSSWTKIESTSGGWGIAGPDVEVGDTIYTVTIGHTQNNTPIQVPFVLRENAEQAFRLKGFALDHLGFHAARRGRPTRDLVAPMPPRSIKGDRLHNIQIAIDPATAFQLTSPHGCRTVGYGWRTRERSS